MKTKILPIKVILAISSMVFAFSTIDIDQKLQRLIKVQDLSPKTVETTHNKHKIELGRLLFFDKLLSGNKDISCATCHHPTLGSSDGLALSIGVGGKGLGSRRKMGAQRDRIPRNSPDIFNRGSSDWHSMFWDSRVKGSVVKGYDTPADEKFPEGLESILAAQAMFPVTSRDEMRGDVGDKDIFGEPNELALISNASPQAIWHRLMLRIMKFPTYQELFKKAYPEIKEEELGFQHAANAIAAFEVEAFTFNDSPWDKYMAGDKKALSKRAKRGAGLFYGKANCVTCHSSSLMTDQETHNIGVPQLGPGKGNAEPLDVGRYLETGLTEDLFAFRTPPLKNVALTGPWMHNGAYFTLEDAVRHHFDPEKALQNYDCSQLPEELRSTCQQDKELNKQILKNLDPKLKLKIDLNKGEVKDLLAFLNALTDKSALKLDQIIPAQVPSGLPVADD